MMGIHSLGVFIASGLLLNVLPGPDVLYIIGQSTTRGARAGSVAALGIAAGTLVHICAAALGLSALLAASAHAFTVIKVIGALYLLYMGFGLLFTTPRSVIAATPAAARGAAGRDSAGGDAGVGTIFVQGFLTNVLNPKVALFFLAFLPQFVAADAPSKSLAILMLGVIFDLNGTLWNLSVALFTAYLARRLGAAGSATRTFEKWFNRGVGTLFVGLGIKLAWADP